MAFGMKKKIRGSPTPGVTKVNGIEPQRDETESTVDDFFDDEENECKQVPINEKKAAESIETALVELHHDLREKSAQCEILRETLSTMSVKMKRQECRLQEKIAEVEEQIRLLEEKTVECEQWKLKYESLQEVGVEKVVAATASTATKLSLVPLPPIIPAIDPLLGDSALLSSFSDRRPWRRNEIRSPSKTPESNEELDEGSAMDMSCSEDSIAEPHGSELDTVYSPKRSPRRSYKPKKNHEFTKAFHPMPMSWLGDEKEDKPTKAIATSDKQEIKPLEAVEAMEALEQVADEASTLEEEGETLAAPDEEEVEKEVTYTHQNEESNLASDPDGVVADKNMFLTLDASKLSDEDCDKSGDEIICFSTLVDDISVVSCISVDTVEMELKSGIPGQLNYAPMQDTDSNKMTETGTRTLIEKQRARIRKMAKREARMAQFAIEKVEC